MGTNGKSSYGTGISMEADSQDRKQLLRSATFGQRSNRGFSFSRLSVPRFLKSRFTYELLAAFSIFIIDWYSQPTPAPSTAGLTSYGGNNFQIKVPSSISGGANDSALPITGRLMLCIVPMNESNQYNLTAEPRLMISDDVVTTQQVFGSDISALQQDEIRLLPPPNSTFGYPVLHWTDIPSGSYWIQAVLNPYVQYNRTALPPVWLPAFHTFESNEGSLTSPGTLYSNAIQVSVNHSISSTTITKTFVLDNVVPDLPPLVETEYLRHVSFQSPLLTKFWGTPVFLKAWVLLPFGFHDHPKVSYPLFVYHTHYSRNFEFKFNPSTNFSHDSVDETYGHYFYKNWTSSTEFKGRRGLLVQLQHANPYYDDSYAVNSANLGPYGDAITYEFIPHIESLYRGIGEGWARTLYGGSTGGWESFAVQVFYPKAYSGAWSFCPDALDFHNVQLVDIYDDDNAYYRNGVWSRNDVGSKRDFLGRVIETMAEENHHELARGSLGRSGGQWDVWQAVYGPVDLQSGYPTPIWNKESGEIDHKTAAYWKDNYDLLVKLQREWPRIGKYLQSKLHVYVGVMDSFYLNGAVYRMEDFLRNNATDPVFNGTIEYGVSDGKGFEHCWSGSFDETLSLAWNTLNQRLVPKMVDHILQYAPADADLSWTTY